MGSFYCEESTIKEHVSVKHDENSNCVFKDCTVLGNRKPEVNSRGEKSEKQTTFRINLTVASSFFKSKTARPRSQSSRTRKL